MDENKDEFDYEDDDILEVELSATNDRESFHYGVVNKATLKKRIARIAQIATITLGVIGAATTVMNTKEIKNLSSGKAIVNLFNAMPNEQSLDINLKQTLGKTDYEATRNMTSEEKMVYFDKQIALAKKLLAIHGLFMVAAGGAFYIASNKHEKFSIEEAEAIYDLAYDKHVSKEVRDIIQAGMLMSGEEWIDYFGLDYDYDKISERKNDNLAFLDEIDFEKVDNNLTTPAKTYAYNIMSAYSFGKKQGFLEGFMEGFKESHRVNVVNKGLGDLYKIDEKDYRERNNLDNIEVELEGDFLLSYSDGYVDGFNEAYPVGYEQFLSNLEEAKAEEEELNK